MRFQSRPRVISIAWRPSATSYPLPVFYSENGERVKNGERQRAGQFNPFRFVVSPKPPSDYPAAVKKPCVLIIVENLPVPLDRRVWQESCALRDAGYEVVVICPKMRGYTRSEEILDGIQIYRHWISEEAGGFSGFFREYASALWGEKWLAWKVWRRHRFDIIHLCNPPDLLFLIAWPFKLLGVRIVCDVHDVWPEMFEAKFGKRGFFYWVVRAAERLTSEFADVVMATNNSVRNVVLTRGRRNE